MRLILLCVLLACGCETVVGTSRTDADAKFASEQRSVLDSGELSTRTADFLARHSFDEPSDVAAYVRASRRRDAAIHLAELAYQRAREASDDEGRMYLTAAVYAWAFLFDPGLGRQPNPFDPAFYWASELYERSLVKLGARILEPGSRSLPYLDGELRYEGPPAGTTRVYAETLEAEGVEREARIHGLGAPLVATRKEKSGYTMSWAETLVVRFEGTVIDTKPLSGRGEIYDPTVVESIDVAGRTAVLEADFTTALANAYGAAGVVNEWSSMLRSSEYLEASGLYAIAPYNPDKIPVVFVHGLKSTPRTWATMLNDLCADAEFRRNYQIWLFGYPTGMPVLYSAMKLRESLARAHEEHAYEELVLVGHSMGGMVSRLMVSDSGDRVWNVLTTTPLDKFDVSEESRNLLRRAMFFDPVPQIRRVIFVSAPLAGADMAAGWYGTAWAELIDLPPLIEKVHAELAKALEKDPGSRRPEGADDANRVTSIGNLRPDHPVTKEVASWPIAPGVVYHSVIGDREAAGRKGGTDGIVAYWSSHIEGSASELIVKSGHHAQKTAAGIAEVRRILLLHLDERERR